MNKYCSNCGKQLKEGADICLHCGVLVNKTSVPVTNKNSGKGSSIAGMVLGIVACVWAFFALVGMENLPHELKYLYSTAQYVGYAVGYTLFSFAPSIVGLCLSVSSIKKQKNGKNTAGLVLNIIALLISVVLIITILGYI